MYEFAKATPCWIHVQFPGRYTGGKIPIIHMLAEKNLLKSISSGIRLKLLIQVAKTNTNADITSWYSYI